MAQDEDLSIRVGLTEAQYRRALARIESRTQKAAQKAEDRFKKANRTMQRGFDRSSRSANSFANGGMRNVSMQLSQVAQQGAASGDYLRALSIQLPDLALGFGSVGIAIGAAGAVMGPFISDLVRGGEEAQTTEEALEELGTAVDRYEEAVRQAATPTAALREEYGDLADEAERLFRAQEQLERLELFSALGNARTAIRDVFGSLEGVTEEVLQDIDGAKREIEELNRPQVNEQGIDTRSGAEIREAIERGEELRTAVKRTEAALGRMREELDLSEQEASELLTEFLRFSDAVETTDPGKMLPAIQSLRRAYFEAAMANGELSEEQAKVARQLSDVEQRIFSTVNAQREAGEAAEMTADEIAEAALAALDLEPAVLAAADALGGAADEAGRLARSLGISSAEAARLAAMERAGMLPGDPGGGIPGSAGSNMGAILPEVDMPPNPPSDGRSARRASETIDPLAAGRETAEQLRQDMQLLGQSAQRVAELRTKWAALAAAKRAGIPITEELRGRIEAQAAEVGRLTGELERSRAAQEEFDRALDDIAAGLADAITEGESFRESMSNTFRQLANDILRSGIREALDVVFDRSRGGGGGFLSGVASLLFGRRASGGPVAAGRPYLVGEQGPEIMAPNNSGRILNAAQTERAFQSGASSSAVNLNFSPVVDARGADEAAVRRLEAGLLHLSRTFDQRTHEAMNRARNRGTLPGWG